MKAAFHRRVDTVSDFTGRDTAKGDLAGLQFGKPGACCRDLGVFADTPG